MQFGGQAPGTSQEQRDAAIRKFGFEFDVMDKLLVNGDGAHPLWQWLRTEKGGLLGDKIKWNFTKFLVGRDGQVVKRYAPTTEPKEIAADIEELLG